MALPAFKKNGKDNELLAQQEIEAARQRDGQAAESEMVLIEEEERTPIELYLDDHPIIRLFMWRWEKPRYCNRDGERLENGGWEVRLHNKNTGKVATIARVLRCPEHYNIVEEQYLTILHGPHMLPIFIWLFCAEAVLMVTARVLESPDICLLAIILITITIAFMIIYLRDCEDIN
jgi:hypothetical protein